MVGLALALLAAAPAEAARWQAVTGDWSVHDIDLIDLPRWEAPAGSVDERRVDVGDVVGDFDGDGLDDVAAVVPRDGAWGVDVVSGRAGEPRGRVRIRLGGEARDVRRAGDIDGDGRADLVVLLPDEVLVVFGGAWGHDLDGAAPGAAGMRITGFDGNERPQWVAALGDVDGTGRDALGIVTNAGAVRVVRAGPARAATADIDDGSRLVAPAAVEPRVWPAGDIDADGRDDVLVTWRERDPDQEVAVAVSGASIGAEVHLGTVAAAGRGWRLTHPEAGGFEPIPDQNRDGRTDLLAGRRRVVLAPAPGTDARAADLPGFATGAVNGAMWPVVDVGDQSGDGIADLGSGHIVSVLHADADRQWLYPLPATGGWTAHGWRFEAGRVLGATTDVDGDGFREIAVLEGNERSGEGRISIWRSRGLPHGPPPTPGPPEPPAPPLRGAEPPWPVDQDMAMLAASPAYAGGRVTFHVRTPLGAWIANGETFGRAWGGTSETALGTPSGASSPGRRWMRVDVELTPDLRAELERSGRLRMRLDLWLGVPRPFGWDWRHTIISAIVVTRPPDPALLPRPRTLRGDFGRQRLLGSPLSDLISGRSADDVLLGRGGPDVLRGGTGDDRLLGQDGDDRLDGDDGDDLLDGGSGNDALIESRFGEDRVDGGPGDDWIEAGRGGDVVRGGAGDDVIFGGSGADRVDCGPGEDVVFRNFAGEEGRATGCEHVYEEPGVVHVRCAEGGTDDDETLLGSPGPDVCEARGGSDDVEGGGGDDRIVGGAGADRLFGRFGADTISGGPGDDELEGGRGPDALDGGPGDDRLNGGYDVDTVAGGAGDDRVIARGGGADVIRCGAGADVVEADSADRVAADCETVQRSG